MISLGGLRNYKHLADVADHKAPYKRLAGGVEFVDVIAKNRSGKLLRRVLRDKAVDLRQKRLSVKAHL
jgi:acyl-coenzyme A synthetase/AMP-(fatty) acid ligase